MPKNIEVVDEAGSMYEPTWPKRAKGLVKHGRARFVAENRICLACPPDMKMEDNHMSSKKEIFGDITVADIRGAVPGNHQSADPAAVREDVRRPDPSQRG